MSCSNYSLINEYFDKNKEELFETLSELIKINTENNRLTSNESRLTSVMQKKFYELGFDADLYTPDSQKEITEHPDFTPGKDFTGRENLTARLSGKNPKKSLMLAGHADTMPIGDLSLWTVPPTEGIIKDGKIFGRGACDDKYALASMLFFAKALRETGTELKNDVYLFGYRFQLRFRQYGVFG